VAISAVTKDKWQILKNPSRVQANDIIPGQFQNLLPFIGMSAYRAILLHKVLASGRGVFFVGTAELNTCKR